ncbi:nuclear transport factor 2 family protein [Chitinophaga sp. Cy-1792]|uniref:nuclear transport factor 2 family protein n=1 Tax=Chitinophaga sp. Cy-1792 TaxID=2608339 RepID=UPI0014209B50|nr:nuclear transport factor 2 family protein [Chitinophaga sp. Cy-1792]NIG54538.1 nuclear transport factor 2 family protein [Chitinophaga sp. Cy-1792]
MDIAAFIQDWIAVSNIFDTAAYLQKWQESAILNDPSVGEVFKGHSGIRRYFETYFIGYKTHTKLLRLAIVSKTAAHIEVEFTGEFPGKKVNGTFDFIFKEGKIAEAKAELI